MGGTVYCGDDRTSWRKFIQVSKILSSCKNDLKRRFTQPTRRDRKPYSDNLIGCGPMNLISFYDASLATYLSHFRSRLASDPRDKLYGLLGTLPRPVQQHFKPDYKSSANELYIHIVEYDLQTTGRLDIICNDHGLSDGPKLLKLPSWVPDWSQPIDFYPLVKSSLDYNGVQFHASRSVVGQFELLGDTRSKLRMKAIYLGSVKAIGVGLGNRISETDVLMALINWCYTFRHFPTNRPESFSRTITLGRFHPKGWRFLCYHIIGVLAARYVPDLQLHRHLQPNPRLQLDFEQARKILKEDIWSCISGRRFFVTDNNDTGLARGSFDRGCVVCVPLGVSSTGNRLHIHTNLEVTNIPKKHIKVAKNKC